MVCDHLKYCGLACITSAGFFTSPLAAVPVVGLLNGSFEETGNAYVEWSGGLYEAKGWINLSSGNAYEAASMLGGEENTPLATHGERVLRLATDADGMIGRVAQCMGTMVEGETYVFTADAFSTPDGPWSVTAALVREPTAAPTTVHASQTLDLLQEETAVLTVSYTATTQDAGQNLCVWIEANGPDSTRGGIDNARLENRLPAAPAGPHPADAGLADSGNLVWESTPGAMNYQVFVWLDGTEKPTVPTGEVLTPTWSLGVLGGTLYHWQVVAANSAGSTTGPEWSFSTGIIPYTYVYQLDSIHPNIGSEWITPALLNDGLVGTDGGVLYDSSIQLTQKPGVTLNLAAASPMGKLTVWYSRSIDEGIAEPASLTVTDGFGHSATTLFATPPGNGTFSQDVSLAGMQGTVLHLDFTGTGSVVGLHEILVQGPVDGLPQSPLGPRPAVGNVNVPLPVHLEWNACVGATHYEITLWNQSDAKPEVPTADVTTNHWVPSGISVDEATYCWQVVAKNASGSAEGAVWSFTTSISPFTYTYDDVSARPENYGGGYGETRATPHVLNDGQTGGWGGGGLVLYYGKDYNGLNPAAYWPALTLTLAQTPATYEVLRIWHYGGSHAEGVYGPASLTVTDDFGHSVTFSDFPDIETFTDVPIAGLQGATLHLRFSPNGYLLGLSEIKVIGTSNYQSWAAIHAQSQLAYQDADHDGVPNAVEFFMGAPDGFTANPGVVNRKVTWPRHATAASFTVQISDNLAQWTDVSSGDAALEITPSQVRYTLSGTRKFCRLAVTP
jgi:hypothetical protein